LSTLPRYQACVPPFPITLSDTNDLVLLSEWHGPNAPLSATSLEQ